MPHSNIMILIGIISAFTAFGLALAWAEYQTRHLSREHTEVKPQVPSEPDDMRLAA
jgi:hypothetical protein